MGFEVFKTVNGTDFDYSSPFDTPTNNMSVDPEAAQVMFTITTRGNHQFGVTSTFSNIPVTIPYPLPPLQLLSSTTYQMMRAEHFRYQVDIERNRQLRELYVTDYQHNSTRI